MTTMGSQEAAKTRSLPAANEQIAQSVAPAKGNTLLKQLIGFGIGGALLWLSFKNVNMHELWQHIKKLDPMWLAVVGVGSLLSHWLRAVRWVILLKPLSDHKISLFNSFAAVMIGYAVNIAVPRGGEVARLVSIARSEKLPWAGVLPTMFIDRLLDVGSLVLLLGVTLVLLPPEIRSAVPWLVPAGAAMCVATAIGVAILPQTGKIISFILQLPMARNIPEKTRTTLCSLATQFDQGTRSLTDPVGFPMIALLSVLIWACYWANLYILLWSFNLQDRVSPAQSLVVFTIGSVGVLVPTPGNVGSFHILTSNALSMVSKLEPALALAFATVLHAWSFVAMTCIAAAVVLFIQNVRSGRTRWQTPIVNNTRD